MTNNILKWEPDNFELELNSVWSFPERGNWATHDSKYRGNWSPYIPRNLILRYSKENSFAYQEVVNPCQEIFRFASLKEKAIITTTGI